MIIFRDLSSLEYQLAKTNIKEKGQTKLVCNRVLQNDLTRNEFGVTRQCAILDKWGY